MELKYIVYITINLCNGKFYIGVHETNPNVFDGYIGDGIYRQNQATKNYTFHRAVRKYGYKNFKRTTLKIFPHTEEGLKAASDLEATLVNETVLKSKNCYNEALGGIGGNSLNNIKTVYMFDLNGEYLRSFKCSKDAALFLKTDNFVSAQHAIRNNCEGKVNSSFGYYWSYKKEFGYNSSIKTKVAQYTLNGKFLRSFNSIVEAESALEINTIQQAITKGYSAGGFQWKYFTGDTSNIPKLVNIKTKNNTIPIIAINKETLVEEEFNSVNDCINKYPDLKASQINRVLSNIIKSHKGFIFKYKDKDIA